IRGAVYVEGASIDGRGQMTGIAVGGGLRRRGGKDRKIAGPVSLRDAKVGRDLALSDSSMNSQETDQEPALNVVNGAINGSVYLNGMSAAGKSGALDMSGVHIGGGIYAGGASFKAATGDAIALAGARVGADILLIQTLESDGCFGKRFEASGGINLQGASIGGNLVCQGCRTDGRNALNCAVARIAGSVDLRSVSNKRKVSGKNVLEVADPFTAVGKVSFSGATVGGDLNCSGAELANENDLALDCSWAKIHGVAYFCAAYLANGEFRPFRVNGGVSFYGAEIGGHLDCSGG